MKPIHEEPKPRIDDQPKHTQGELKINKYGSIVDKNGDTILVAGVGFPMGKNEEAEANAQRIVKCCNNEWKIDMHNEFVERIKKAVKDLSRPHSDGSIALHELQQLLKQAEGK